jgi:hypothetical protein
VDNLWDAGSTHFPEREREEEKYLESSSTSNEREEAKKFWEENLQPQAQPVAP